MEVHNSIENIDEQIRKLENKSIDNCIEEEQIQTTKVFKIGDDTLLEQRQSEKKECFTRRSSKSEKLILVLICLFVAVLLIFMFFIK